MTKTEVILGLFLGIIISTILYMVFLVFPDNGLYYLIFVNERFLMVICLTIGILVSFGILSIAVLLILLRGGKYDG